jgi:serpin B
MRRGREFGRRSAGPYALAAVVICSAALLGFSVAGAPETPLDPEASNVYAAVRTELVEASTRFALDLYQALSGADGNLFFSPYSISAALAMTYAGARGETEAQMGDALHFTLPQRVLHPAFHALDANLMQRASEIEGLQLAIANALWGQDGHPFLADFLDLLEASYGAPMETVDFVGASEQARADINEWASEKTEGKISDLMPPGSVTPDTRLVLANAIYFYGTWKLQFNEEHTRDGLFLRLDRTDVLVPLMSMQDDFPYAEGENYQAIELLYTGDRLSMVVLLPDVGSYESFEDGLNVESLNDILAELVTQEVQLAMPRFELNSEFSLAGTLSRLGMPDAFSGAADFSGMDGLHDLFIAHVAHKAFVSVDEKGTEAAAATGISMALSIADYVRMTINRPFIFLVRDREAGTILFMGRVLDPSAG